MKDNSKVFIKSKDGGYKEISYKKLLEERKRSNEYKIKKFIKIDDYLLEVSELEYIEFDAEDQREKYVDRLKNKYKVLSLDKEYADKTTLKDIITDANEEIADTISRKDEVEKLKEALLGLSKYEYEIIKTLFFENKTVRECSRILGIPRSTVNDKKKIILYKLKEYIENNKKI